MSCGGLQCEGNGVRCIQCSIKNDGQDDQNFS